MYRYIVQFFVSFIFIFIDRQIKFKGSIYFCICNNLLSSCWTQTAQVKCRDEGKDVQMWGKLLSPLSFDGSQSTIMLSQNKPMSHIKKDHFYESFNFRACFFQSCLLSRRSIEFSIEKFQYNFKQQQFVCEFLFFIFWIILSHFVHLCKKNFKKINLIGWFVWNC